MSLSAPPPPPATSQPWLALSHAALDLRSAGAASLVIGAEGGPLSWSASGSTGVGLSMSSGVLARGETATLLVSAVTPPMGGQAQGCGQVRRETVTVSWTDGVTEAAVSDSRTIIVTVVGPCR
ncbi:hypothetical protein [Streptosporangium sp. CA-115845]|uniref:hypothetical protein n=1 Tax=Streptosporangium sp. CA-115845 TaxID=3240071 RepID=UPI003D8AEAAE